MIASNNRSQLLASIANILGYIDQHKQESAMGQLSIFKPQDAELMEEAYKTHTNAELEFEVLNVFLSEHPLDPYMRYIGNAGLQTIAHLKESIPFGASRVKLLAIIHKKDTRMSPRGRFTTLQVSDPTAMVDLSIFSEDVLKEYAALLLVKSIAIFECEAHRDEGRLRLNVAAVSSADALCDSSNDSLTLRVVSVDRLRAVQDLLSTMSQEGSVLKRVKVTVPTDKFCEVTIDLHMKVAITPQNLESLKGLCLGLQ